MSDFERMSKFDQLPCCPRVVPDVVNLIVGYSLFPLGFPTQGRRKHLKLGGARNFEGTFFFLRKRGHFQKIKRALLCLLQNLGGHVPPVPPVPTSMSH